MTRLSAFSGVTLVRLAKRRYSGNNRSKLILFAGLDKYCFVIVLVAGNHVFNFLVNTFRTMVISSRRFDGIYKMLSTWNNLFTKITIICFLFRKLVCYGDGTHVFLMDLVLSNFHCNTDSALLKYRCLPLLWWLGHQHRCSNVYSFKGSWLCIC